MQKTRTSRKAKSLSLYSAREKTGLKKIHFRKAKATELRSKYRDSEGVHPKLTFKEC